MRRRSTMPTLGQTIWSLGFVSLGVAIAAAAAWPIYQTPRVIVVAIVAGLVGIGVAYLAAWRVWQWWLTALTLVAAYAVLVVPVAIPGALQSPLRFLSGVRDGFAGVILGWKQLVTIELPLGDYQAVLVPLFIVLMLGAFGALSLALKPGPSSVLAAPIVLTMFAFGLAFGSSAIGAPVEFAWWSIPGGVLVLLGASALTLCLVWLIGRSRLARREALKRARGVAVGIQQSRETRWVIARRNSLGAAILLIAIGAGFAVAPATVTAVQRTTVRDAANPYVNVSRVQSPLTTYRSWFAGDALTTELFTVDGAPESLDRIRLATLSEFDGTRFELADSTSANFARLANSVPAATDVTVTMTIGEGYAGPWLPLPGEVTSAPSFSGSRSELLADGVFVAPGGTTAVVVDGDDATNGAVTGILAAGDTFTVSGSPLPRADVLDGVQGGEPLIDGEVYSALATWVDQQEVPRTSDGLIDALDRLRERGFLSHARSDDTAAAGWISALSARSAYRFEPSLAGHSTARIEALFTSLNDQQLKAGEDATNELLVSAVGDDEQFATAAALLARYFGFNSRVAYGVILSTNEALPSVLPCSADGVCTGANVTAWTEVQAPNGQWVRLDATPQFSETLSRVVVGEILPEHPTVPDQPSSEVLAPPTSIRADSDEPPAGSSDASSALGVVNILRWVGIGSAVLLLLFLPALVLIGAKAVQRRQRRTEPVAEAAIVGAWEELIDTYDDAGLDFSRKGTRRQIALSTGRPAALAVADAVDLAVFDSSSSMSPAAIAVWDIVQSERAELTKSKTWRQRWASALSVTAFMRHFRESRVRRVGAVATYKRRTS